VRRVRVTMDACSISGRRRLLTSLRGGRLSLTAVKRASGRGPAPPRRGGADTPACKSGVDDLRHYPRCHVVKIMAVEQPAPRVVRVEDDAHRDDLKMMPTGWAIIGAHRRQLYPRSLFPPRGRQRPETRRRSRGRGMFRRRKFMAAHSARITWRICRPPTATRQRTPPGSGSFGATRTTPVPPRM